MNILAIQKEVREDNIFFSEHAVRQMAKRNINDNDVVETRDIDENMNIDLDESGKLVSMTIEHAKQRTDVTNFSYQQVAEQ